ncbi:dienelactone hydrolase [Parerythrobacter aurantius]|uniref:alpha/beta hydrolase family protein n=1 Tax=Parerythrobacter aurantius TaxID=3127706 RepID=UPI003250CE5D
MSGNTKRAGVLLAAAALLLSYGAAATAEVPSSPPPAWSVAPAAPELARIGPWNVGTTVRQLPVAMAGSRATERVLEVRLFYPAIATSGPRATYLHTIRPPQSAEFVVQEAGLAYPVATPATEESFPLVVVSHGFGGWETHLSRICEVLASHGYVVAAIDHADERFDTVPGFLASFSHVLLRRSNDQRQAIAQLTGGEAGAGLAIATDTPVGLVGYSMGGYGALGTAGASYDAQSSTLAGLPASDVAALSEVTADPATGLGALVLIAPWGGQPDSRMWTGPALAQVKTPTLLIGGSADKIVNYGEGLRWIYDHIVGSDRRFLTFREAGHNIAGNAIPLTPGMDPQVVDYFGEPVWQRERLNQAISHFVVAFLDAQLKGMDDREAYLSVPTEDANDGQWPLAFGTLQDGRTAGEAEPGYWRGFQRGWAAGMTLEHKQAGE